MFGRKPRVKNLEQIGRELDELRRFNVRSAFFVDDNLIGNLPMARKLLQYLKEYQEKHNYWFSFGTEATLNMAQHEDLLELFRAANFSWVFIGIESPDPASLKETLKTQNLHEDILTSLRRIYSYGIDVLAGFIIGFDNDTLDSFEHQYRFITDAGIQSAMIGLLTALPKTPLYERLEKEGRLSPLEHASDNTRPGTNVIPKGMPYVPPPAGRPRDRAAHQEQIAPPGESGVPRRRAAGVAWHPLAARLRAARGAGHSVAADSQRHPPWRPESRVAFPALDALVDAFARPHRDLGLDCGPVHARLCRAAPDLGADRGLGGEAVGG